MSERNWLGFKKKVVSEARTDSGPSEIRAAVADVKQPPTRAVAPTVNQENAMSITSVYRSVSIISTATSQLSLTVMRNDREVSVPALIKRPDVNTSTSAFLEMTVTSMALSGNAYWRLYRADAGSPVTNIEVLNPHNMFVERDQNSGRLVYTYGTQKFQEWQIKHLKLMRVPGSDYGLGPIQAAKNELAGILDLRTYADNWFREAGVPTGVLTTDQVLNAELADDYKARWNETNGGVRVLGSGLSYAPTMLNPEDALFVQVSQFSVAQVARLFGIPASYLLASVEGNSLTYSNITQVDTQFVRYSLMAYLNEIEDALSDLIPRGQTVKFKIDDFLRADVATRYQVYSLGIEKGILTVEEARKMEGLPPL